MKPRIYLCGQISGITDRDATEWRQKAKELLGDCFELVDPMRRDYRGIEIDYYREIVDLDKLDVRTSDAVLFWYERPSVGSSMELFYAHQLQIPTITVNQTDRPLSPWLVYHSSAIVSDLELAAHKLKDWFQCS